MTKADNNKIASSKDFNLLIDDSNKSDKVKASMMNHKWWLAISGYFKTI